MDFAHADVCIKCIGAVDDREITFPEPFMMQSLQGLETV